MIEIDEIKNGLYEVLENTIVGSNHYAVGQNWAAGDVYPSTSAVPSEFATIVARLYDNSLPKSIYVHEMGLSNVEPVILLPGKLENLFFEGIGSDAPLSSNTLPIIYNLARGFIVVDLANTIGSSKILLLRYVKKQISKEFNLAA